MVVVGGVTRLTHSGLSIVEWQPLVGAIPPLDDAEWERTFAKYRETPEFRLRNHDMTLAGFKGIFWWEYAHRLLGRLVGVAFLLPFLYFLAKRRVDRALGWKLAAVFALGALQGALGWYMVKSGLVDDPRVSQFRLAGHLGLAFAIYGAMLWIALGLLAAAPEGRVAIPLRRLATALVAIVFVMVLSGALVAGIRAGFAYNTFPTMNGHLVPPEILMIEPWWKNFGYNMATVQFDHRAIAWLLVILVPWAWVLSRRLDPPMSAARGWANALLAMLAVQFTLGVVTLLNGVPLAAAALHQAGAVLVFTCAIGMRHSLGDQRA
jgi:cytochrome c oxidase assembly protein subunit 15